MRLSSGTGTNGAHRPSADAGSNKIQNYKIVVLGDGGVGKSALTLQFVSHRFPESRDPTIEDAYQRQVVIDGEASLLDILDTAGQIEFTAMREQYMRFGEGFLICYSITERRSFEEVLDYRKQILKVRAVDSIPIVLVGNKMDLRDNRKVSREEGQALASSMGCPFFETSAAFRHYVDDCFYELVREIRKKQKEEREADEKAVGRGKFHSRWKRFKEIFLWAFQRKR